MSFIKSHMRAELEGHTLAEIPAGPECRMFRMGRNGTRLYLVQLLFTPEGIAIMGDIQIGHGIVSTRGYKFDWFSQHLSEEYLCEKFLPKVWVHTYAADWCRDVTSEEDDDERRDALLSCAKSLETDGMSEHEFHDRLVDMGFSEGPGHAYDPTDAGWLCVIQQRFVKLVNVPQSVTVTNAGEAR